MKKLYLVPIILMLLCSCAGLQKTQSAADWTKSQGVFDRGDKIVIQMERTISADITAEELPSDFSGCYLYQGEGSATADDAWTAVVYSELGNPLFTLTETAATSADSSNLQQPTAYYVIGEDETVTATTSGCDSGTCTFKFSCVKK